MTIASTSSTKQLIRPAAIAGQFYSSDKQKLSHDIDIFLNNANITDLGLAKQIPKAIIVPHAGYIYSGQCAANAYANIIGNSHIIKNVILLAPCHRVAIQGIASSNADFWNTPLGDVKINQKITYQLNQLDFVNPHDEAHSQEHSLEVHLPFLQKILDDFTLTPLAVGQCEAKNIAHMLDKIWGGPETLIVISTDLSHFNDYDNAIKIDNNTAKNIMAMNWQEISGNDACGHVPMSGLLYYAKSKFMQIKQLDICNSAAVTGDKSRVVGYGAWAIYENKIEPNDDMILMQKYDEEFADYVTRSIKYGLDNSQQIKVDLPSFAKDLQETRATFITLTKNDQLRGCIGSVIPHRPLIIDLIHNAYAAAFEDPRFKKLTIDELPQIKYAISLLSPMQKMSFTDQDDLLCQLRPNIDGLLIKCDGKQAVFLPQVWDDLPDKNHFLNRLKQKAGIDIDYFSDGFNAWTYQVAKTEPRSFK